VPFLAACARHGRLLLVAGLMAGVAFPALARAMEPLIGPMIAFLLFLAALRIGPEAAWPGRGRIGRTLALTVALQTVPPVLLLGLLALAGWQDSIVGLGLVLALAAAPITGSPGLAILSGADPAPALRQLVLGTALLPLTVLPVFALMPVFADPEAALAAVGRLLFVIVIAGAGAWLLRRASPRLLAPDALAALDGITTIVMALVVVALMSAVGPALVAGDPALFAILALVLAVNFAIQLGVWLLARRLGAGATAPSLAIVAANRNLALFLVALPPETVEALLLFVGCFQVPMYLTPFVMARLYRRDLGLA
jgi:ACR3 family arsenite transporter